MFESELTDILVSGAATFIYITGLVGFMVWLKRGKQSSRVAAK
jgi:hypothetical protein